jgi:hypothetical protein
MHPKANVSLLGVEHRAFQLNSQIAEFIAIKRLGGKQLRGEYNHNDCFKDTVKLERGYLLPLFPLRECHPASD